MYSRNQLLAYFHPKQSGIIIRGALFDLSICWGGWRGWCRRGAQTTKEEESASHLLHGKNVFECNSIFFLIDKMIDPQIANSQTQSKIKSVHEWVASEM
jgi:hypothetical protein